MEDKSRIWGISDVKAFLISIITGFILVTIVAVIFTEISNETVNKTADRVLDFVQTRVNTYEYFIQNDKVKSLYRLSDKTQELVRCMQYEDDIDTFLDEYMYNQRLDGIVVLDGEGECEYYRGIEYTDVDSVIDDSNVKDVIEHPQKVYITRVNVRSGSITYTESQNEEFSDIAVAARKDTKGAVITYVKKESYDNSGDISIDRLISGFEFDMDGIVYISDENKVLNSNDEELQGLDMKALRQKYDGAWKENDNGIIAVPYKKDYYYGKRKQIENYTIYAFFADKQVYALRNRAVAAALFVYIIEGAVDPFTQLSYVVPARSLELPPPIVTIWLNIGTYVCVPLGTGCTCIKSTRLSSLAAFTSPKLEGGVASFVFARNITFNCVSESSPP